MWIDRLINNRTAHASALAAQFSEERQRVLAENVANIDTPDYQAKRLDAAPFQETLRDALDDAGRRGTRALALAPTAQVSQAAGGGLRVTPVTEPAPNALFHDGTNGLLERTMADVMENSLTYEFATTMVRRSYEGMLRAIRGRVT